MGFWTEVFPFGGFKVALIPWRALGTPFLFGFSLFGCYPFFPGSTFIGWG